jgi:uncharacterized protein (TIGR02145 family)
VENLTKQKGIRKMEHETGTFTDSRDGKAYRTEKIGRYTWLAENLSYRTDEGSWCYDDDEANADKWGRLYTWDAAVAACPKGWHLPTFGEWKNLIMRTNSAAPLKAKSGWGEHGNGTDYYRFSALPGGKYDCSGKGFHGAGMCGGWWTNKESKHSDNAASIVISDYSGDNKEANLYYENKGCGLSVRCVKDEIKAGFQKVFTAIP